MPPEDFIAPNTAVAPPPVLGNVADDPDSDLSDVVVSSSEDEDEDDG